MMAYTDIFKKKDLKLDTFVKGDGSPVTSFSQGDRLSDKLFFNVTNDSVILDLTDAVNVRMDFRKPDGKLVFQYCTMENKASGTASIVLNSQTVAVPGTVQAEVTVEYPTGKKLVTRRFSFHVDEAIAGDASIQSADFAPMLDKAIEAGDKLEGVDIDGIIAAGAKADAALPKAGGTMTGNINFNVAGSSKRVEFSDGASKLFGLYSDPNKFMFQDLKNNTAPWEYSHADQTFKINSLTNVYKKTELYPNWVQPNGHATYLANGTDLDTLVSAGVHAGGSLLNAPEGTVDSAYVVVYVYGSYILQRFTSLSGANRREFVRRRSAGTWSSWQRSILDDGGQVNGNISLQQSSAGAVRKFSFNNELGEEIFNFFTQNGNLAMRDVKGAQDIFVYAGATKTFNLVAPSANVVRTTGDAMTGAMVFRHNVTQETSDSQKGVQQAVNNSANKWVVGPKTTGTIDWSKEMSMDLTTGVVSVVGLKTSKDGTSTLTLTADAELFGANGVIAVRRGNTVAIRAPFRRKAGSTNLAVLATLPTDMRPVGFTVQQGVTSTDGAQGIFTVATDGNITLQNATATDVAGKNFYVTCAFVVD